MHGVKTVGAKFKGIGSSETSTVVDGQQRQLSAIKSEKSALN